MMRPQRVDAMSITRSLSSAGVVAATSRVSITRHGTTGIICGC
jgi:hypothetical protein